jgi:hypothetical protein
MLTHANDRAVGVRGLREGFLAAGVDGLTIGVVRFGNRLVDR